MFDSFVFLSLIVFDCSLIFVDWFRLILIASECFWLLSCALSDLQIGIYRWYGLWVTKILRAIYLLSQPPCSTTQPSPNAWNPHHALEDALLWKKKNKMAKKTGNFTFKILNKTPFVLCLIFQGICSRFPENLALHTRFGPGSQKSQQAQTCIENPITAPPIGSILSTMSTQVVKDNRGAHVFTPWPHEPISTKIILDTLGNWRRNPIFHLLP